MSLPWAEFIAGLSNWSLIFALVVGVIATYGIVVSGNVKEAGLKAEIARQGAIAASANERAAKLERDASEARLKYEELRRTVANRSLDPREERILVEALSKSPSVVSIVYPSGDSEAQNFARDLGSVFKQAGWRIQVASRPFLGAFSGLWIGNEPYDTSKFDRDGVPPVREAFRQAGFDFSPAGPPVFDRGGMGRISAPVVVIAGSKPLPSLN